MYEYLLQHRGVGGCAGLPCPATAAAADADAWSSAGPMRSCVCAFVDLCNMHTPSCVCLPYPAAAVAADAEAWSSAGGESYCDNKEFTNLLAKRWLEVLSKPGVQLALGGLPQQ
jgi:hypothetical protein